jgi:hypothetical protein
MVGGMASGCSEIEPVDVGFRGQKFEFELGKAYGFTENLGVGQIYKYRFTTSELKRPLQAAVAVQGWRWCAVAFGKV